MTSKNFALIGAAGYVAPRHMEAIKATGNRLVAAIDPSDSVGILDRYSYETSFFTEFERFDRFVEKSRFVGRVDTRFLDGGVDTRSNYQKELDYARRHQYPNNQIDYVAICSPNYLHDAHIRWALRSGCDVICEKPLVINPKNLYGLQRLEEETDHKIWCILQMRHHPEALACKDWVESHAYGDHFTAELIYHTPRGKWYDYSWKGSQERSGGVLFNIGVHLFDMLTWALGPMEGHMRSLKRGPHTWDGVVHFKNAKIEVSLSTDPEFGSPDRALDVGGGLSFDFTKGFEDLHTKSYEEILAGRGFGIDDARPAIELVHTLREY